MGYVLEGLKPEKVFKYFEDICNIPHVSYHTDRISGYCEEFAKEHDYRYIRDEVGNVVIFKPATPGYENHKTVMLQGHLDMVGAKADNKIIDFENESISIKTFTDKSGLLCIGADGTTLGGDDGIAIAYALAILDSNDIKHPPLECVFTVDEEVGLLGANALDCSVLESSILLNIDSEDEDIFLTGCAGGLRTDLMLDVDMTSFTGKLVEIVIDGLKGGHSGTEIGTGRASANVLMGRLLKTLDDKGIDLYISELNGGLVDNAICSKASAKVVVESIDKLDELIKEFNLTVNGEYNGIEDNINVRYEIIADGDFEVATDIGREKILFLLRLLPHGVISRNPIDIKLVETSLNMGIMRFSEGKLRLGFSIRSSNKTAKRELADRIEYMIEFIGGEYEESGDYPAWPFKLDSPLRDIIKTIYQEEYSRKPIFETIHAGLECGIFADKMNGLDIISFGPDMKDIHTANEVLYVDSVDRVYKFLISLLERL